MKKYLVWYIILCTSSSLLGYRLPGINLGFTNILDGGPVRPYPGIYWQQYLQYYSTERFLDGEGKPLGGVPSPRFRLLDTITQMVYQCKYQMRLGGMPGFVLSLTTVLYSKINKNRLGIRSSGSGFGNLGCGIYMQWPAIMYKGRPLFIHRLEFDFAIPMGKNKLPAQQINPSNTFFYCGPYWAATLFLSHTWSLSWRLNYLWNAQNEKINSRAGDAMYLNYSLAYEIYPHLHVGAVGYALGQLHNDRVDGITVPNSKERVFGIGPGLAYFFSEDIVFFSYVYLEAGARNRTQGTNFITRLVMHF